MKVYFSLLLVFVSINIFAQSDICQECETLLKKGLHKEHRNRCTKTDTILLDNNILLLKEIFKCENKEIHNYYSKNDTIPFQGFLIEDNLDTIYLCIHKGAEFKGGQNKMIKYLQKNIKYPKYALKNRIEGTVYVSFSISSTGKIYNVKIKKGAEDSLNQESIRVIQSMPNWIPAVYNEKPVTSKMRIPIKYRLPK